jgi:N utilization substance protein B
MSSTGATSLRTPRSIARQMAFQLLYRDELNPTEATKADEAAAGADLDEQNIARLTQEVLSLDDEDQAASDPKKCRLLQRQLTSPEVVEFAQSLIKGVRRHRQQIDEHLAKTAHHWRVERMAVTDRAILRLAAFEILYTETPDAVAVDEAIELAKRFGSKQSGQFVNGILDRVMHDREEELST